MKSAPMLWANLEAARDDVVNQQNNSVKNGSTINEQKLTKIN